MAEKIEIIISAVDQASDVFRGIGDLGSNVLGAGMWAAAGGIAAVTAGLGLAISEAMEAEQVQAQLNAVIESTGGVAGMTADEVNDLATELSRVTTYSDDAIISAESMLLTFTNIGEDVFPLATETVLNMGQVFGSTDAAAIQLGKALNDPVEGITALTRVGVTFTEEQQAAIEAMVESGDVAGAQGVILGELEREFGGAARAAGDTFAGQLIILKNQLLDVAEGIGMELLPVLRYMTTQISRSLVPAIQDIAARALPVFRILFNTLSQFIGEWQAFGFVEALRSFFRVVDDGEGPVSDFGNILWNIAYALGASTDFVVPLQAAVADFANTLIGFVTGALIPFVQDHLPAFQNALIAVGAVIVGAGVLAGILSIGAAIAALFNPITLVIGAVALLAMAWTEDWGGIRTTMTDVWNNTLRPALEELGAWLGEVLPPIIADLSALWRDDLQPALQQVGDFIAANFIPVMTTLGSFLIDVVVFQVQTAAWYFTNVMLPAIQIVADVVSTYVIPALTTLVEGFRQVWEFLDVSLMPRLYLLSSWLSTRIGEVIDAAVPFLATLVQGFRQVWEFLDTNLMPKLYLMSSWLATRIGEVIGTANTVITTLVTAFGTVSDFMRDEVLPRLDALATLFATTIPGAIGTVTATLSTFANFLSATLSTPIQAFKDLVEGIGSSFSGMLGPIQSIVDEFGDLLDTLSRADDVIPDWLRPGSPTPFEIGLRGIRDAMSDLDGMPLLDTFGGLPVTSAGGMPMLGGGGGGGRESAGNGSVTNWNLTINAPNGGDNLVGSVQIMKAWAGA